MIRRVGGFDKKGGFGFWVFGWSIKREDMEGGYDGFGC